MTVRYSPLPAGRRLPGGTADRLWTGRWLSGCAVSTPCRSTCGHLDAKDRQRSCVRSLTQVNDGYRVWHRLAGGARLLYLPAVHVKMIS